ncbi:unnamed protein product [Dicrocoelium dendriticum]|nr:unnamed protein product [Dicrocoelium dendriticum]
MGCGVSKLSIPSSTGEVADNHLENGRASALNEPDQGNITAGHKSPETHSTRPTTPRSTDSGDKHSSCSDNESDVRQVSPIRIRADSGRDALPNLSPAVAEMKKGFVAFDIPLNDSQNVEMDNILKKPLPRRLRRLEPLGNAPLITTEMLMEKLEKAEAKRRKVLLRRGCSWRMR